MTARYDHPWLILAAAALIALALAGCEPEEKVHPNGHSRVYDVFTGEEVPFGHLYTADDPVLWVRFIKDAYRLKETETEWVLYPKPRFADAPTTAPVPLADEEMAAMRDTCAPAFSVTHPQGDKDLCVEHDTPTTESANARALRLSRESWDIKPPQANPWTRPDGTIRQQAQDWKTPEKR